jgi:hypothetical protein
MAPLSSDLRKSLDKAVVAARDEAESACDAAMRALGVPQEQAPVGINYEQRSLRNALRAKQRQLGGAYEQLVSECAYEQWHLMLFARFLAENELLIHPSGGTVTLDEVSELAREEGESDPWLLAARYAAGMLPGIFKTADPCVRLPLAPEGRKALEDILEALPPDVFTADDALGWVYQFWQTKRKREVNASARKIGGADLPPVTQLFTEHYMVRFLLENSLGAWWAGRHPSSPLLNEWGYLRFADDDSPAAGHFEGWPETVAEVTVMDPCCGSGHFLVAAFEMLRRMREEEEGLSAREAVDAVLRDNLCGLELDPRCTQLAAFALALAAWKLTGYYELPTLNLACSGIPTRGSLAEWTRLANGDERLEHALARLHELFAEADTLGSLIDPRRAVEDSTLESVPFDEVAPLLERALAGDADPVAAVFNDGVKEVAKAAALLAGSYTLVATNVPYLGRAKQCDSLAVAASPNTGADLATLMLSRAIDLCAAAGVLSVVSPESWLFLKPYRLFREEWLKRHAFSTLVRLGTGAFSTQMWDFPVVLLVVTAHVRSAAQGTAILDVSESKKSVDKDGALRTHAIGRIEQSRQTENADSVIVLELPASGQPLSASATAHAGVCTGDTARFVRFHWELPRRSDGWRPMRSTPSRSALWSGASKVMLWENDAGQLRRYVTERLGEGKTAAWIRGGQVWGTTAVCVGLMASLPATVYAGELFDDNVAVIAPKRPELLLPLLSFCLSNDFAREVRKTYRKLALKTQYLLKVPFDLAHWQRVAEEQYPNGLPEPHSEDPTQWLFKGNVVDSEQPLHVALARLLGVRWPGQEPDALDSLADEDGIVCLPPVAGERSAHERLRQLLEVAYGECTSQQTIDEMLRPEGCATLADWLQDNAFGSHAKLFHSRPFIWHIWDGQRDGFAALVNYHKLDHQRLEKLIFTYLNWWIERQRTDMGNDAVGAEARLVAAQELQRKLKLILEGEPPYDIYVRWKPLAEQPLGWEPDLDDGVRLNIRPFATAGVLRTKLAVHWKNDRGQNLDGSERLNDLHFTLAEKRAARKAGRSE